MERDDERGQAYDQADEMDEARWHAHDLQQEKEQILEEALDACLKAGVDTAHLRTLVRETGALHWGLKQSLAQEPKREKTWFKD